MIHSIAMAKRDKKDKKDAVGSDHLLMAPRLSDLNIAPLDVREFCHPVVVVHAPRKSGGTRVLGALLASVPGLHGAIVLCDRAETPEYMGGALPHELIMNKSPPDVLAAMIAMQEHSVRRGQSLPNLALAMDDVLYDTRILRRIDVQRNIKRAADYNITILILTANASVLPDNVHTWATHVMATKCVHAKEPALLAKRMFVFQDPSTLQDTLALCSPHEFFVGLMRPALDLPHTIVTLTRTFATSPEQPVLTVARPLLDQIVFAMEKIV